MIVDTADHPVIATPRVPIILVGQVNFVLRVMIVKRLTMRITFAHRDMRHFRIVNFSVVMHVPILLRGHIRIMWLGQRYRHHERAFIRAARKRIKLAHRVMNDVLVVVNLHTARDWPCIANSFCGRRAKNIGTLFVFVVVPEIGIRCP